MLYQHQVVEWKDRAEILVCLRAANYSVRDCVSTYNHTGPRAHRHSNVNQHKIEDETVLLKHKIQHLESSLNREVLGLSV